MFAFMNFSTWPSKYSFVSSRLYESTRSVNSRELGYILPLFPTFISAIWYDTDLFLYLDTMELNTSNTSGCCEMYELGTSVLMPVILILIPVFCVLASVVYGIDMSLMPLANELFDIYSFFPPLTYITLELVGIYDLFIFFAPT